MGVEMPKPEIKTLKEVVEQVNNGVKKITQDEDSFLEKYKQANEELLGKKEEITTKNIRKEIIEPLFKTADPRITELDFDSPDFRKYKGLELYQLSLMIRTQLTNEMADDKPVVTKSMEDSARKKQLQEMKRQGVDDPKDLPGEEK